MSRYPPHRPLDSYSAPDDFPAIVPRLAKLAAILLLAVWLPATLHCDLESAGVKIHGVTHEHHEGDRHHHQEPCADDSCHALDGVSYRSALILLKIAPPSAEAMAFIPVLRPTEVAAPVLSPSRHPPPPHLAPRWHFVSRAAPPARAPSGPS